MWQHPLTLAVASHLHVCSQHAHTAPFSVLFCAVCLEPILAKGLTLACFIARTGAAASTHTGRGITPTAVGARPKATEHNLIDSSDEDEEREALLKPGTNSGTNSGRGITPASM